MPRCASATGRFTWATPATSTATRRTSDRRPSASTSTSTTSTRRSSGHEPQARTSARNHATRNTATAGSPPSIPKDTTGSLRRRSARWRPRTGALSRARRLSQRRRPELEQVPVRVVEVVRASVEDILEVNRPVHVHTGMTHARDGLVEVVARHLERKVNVPEALALRKRRVLLEEQLPSMQCDALRLPRVPGPEPRPFVGRLVLKLEPDDVAVEARCLRNVVDDQDELREPATAHARWASYSPNSSRR